jgi:hypothetical protein
MRARLITLCLLLLCSQAGQVLACSSCYGEAPPKTMQSMSIAIWFLMAALMSVLGGFGAFGFHLWKHSRMPLEPHQELAEEDLEKYE